MTDKDKIRDDIWFILEQLGMAKALVQYMLDDEEIPVKYYTLAYFLSQILEDIENKNDDIERASMRLLKG